MKFFFLSLFVFSATLNFANTNTPGDDDSSEKKLLRNARRHFLYGEYVKAIASYDELIKINPNDPEYLFELGLCYYENGINKEKSVSYFENALNESKTDTIPEILYYLGKAYQYTQEFDKAIDCYNKFEKKITKSSGEALKRDVSGYIAMCENGKEFAVAFREDIIIENLGGVINSIYSEYAPVIKKDGSVMVYTARKKGSTGGEFYHDNKYFEDIYVTIQTNEEWKSPVKLDETHEFTTSEFNLPFHDAAIAFNADESKLFIYRESDIWVSKVENGKFTEPEKMSDLLNTPDHEPSVYLTPDESLLILTSNKAGGHGGRDLYFSKKDAQGNWMAPIPFNSTINTTEDEDAPFISNDGKTMYFSSKGHNSIGGYDIFKSTLDENGNWSTPENLGLPINSGGDDIFYVEDNLGNAYFSSDRAGGIGNMDIYKVSKKKDTTIIAANDPIKDTVLPIDRIEIAKNIVPANFEMNYDYNVYGIKSGDKNYESFLDKVENIVKIKGSVILDLESSASKVPTTTHKTNHNLANLRLNEAKEKILADLKSRNIASDLVTIELFNSKVQGPDYNDDFETNKETYEKYQYFKVTAR